MPPLPAPDDCDRTVGVAGRRGSGAPMAEALDRRTAR